MWAVVYRVADGSIVSQGTASKVADRLPAGMVVKVFDPSPILKVVIWDSVKLDFVSRPPPLERDIDRVSDLVSQPEVAPIIQRLTREQRSTLQRAIADLLGGFRFRTSDEPVDLP